MIPLKLQMVNFGPYADSSIDFNFKSALIIGENLNVSGASNGTGKSTIFQALTWVLTGSSRYKNSNSIIRDGTDSAKVTLLFESGGEKYQIIRGRNRTNKQTLDFNHVLADGRMEPVKADTNSKLDEKIAEVTRVRYDSFVNTAYFAQNTVSEFMYGTSSSRQKLIAEILAMDRWNAYSKNAAAGLSEAEKGLDIARYKLSIFGNLVEQRRKLETDCADLQSKITEISASISSLEAEEEGLRATAEQEASAIQTAATRSATQQLVDSMKKSLTDADERRTAATLKIAALTASIEAARSETRDIGTRPDVASGIMQKLAERKGELSVSQSRISVMEKGHCDTCGSSWNHDHSEELVKLRAQITDARSRIAVGEGKLIEARAAESAWDAENAKAYNVQGRISSLEHDLSASRKEIVAAEDRLAKITAELALAESRLSSIPEYKAQQSGAASRLRDVQTKLSGMRSQYSTASAGIGQVTAKLDVVASQEIEARAMVAKSEELEKDVNLYSALAKHFSKTGIQASILDTVISEIETLSNSFLSRLSHKPFSIKFVTQRPDTKGQVKETLDIEVISPTSTKYIEDLSGGEQFRVGFSIRLALAAVQARRQGGELTLLLLDEVSSSLDKVGIDTFISIVKELQRTMIVMLITHDDSLKEHFDDVLKVRNDGHIAKIIQ
jgi:DNA repair exonuclease SbcCD ATPase subunit